jgi:hypothetical protein
VPLPPPPAPTYAPTSSAPPAYLQTQETYDGVPRWLLWAVPGVIGVMITGGVIVFLATHSSPSRASAGTWSPTAQRTPAGRMPAPRPATPPSYPSARRNPNLPAPTARAMPTPPRPQPQPGVAAAGAALPPLSSVDLHLKKLWQLAEAQGMAVQSLRTLRSSRENGLVVQPVKVELKGTFSQTVLFLQAVRDAMPFAVPDALQVSEWPQTPSSQKITVPPSMTLNCYFADDFAPAGNAGGNGGGAGPGPVADLAGALAEAARKADGRVTVIEMALKSRADVPSSTAASPFVVVTGLVPGDGDVIQYMARLASAARLADVKMYKSEAAQLAGRPVRKFQIEFRVRAPNDPRTVNAPVAAADVPDVFRLTPSLEAAIAKRPTVEEARANPQQAQPNELFRRLERLKLQAIVGADSCVINGQVLRVGEKIEGFTVTRINSESIGLSAPTGEGFEMRVKRK